MNDLPDPHSPGDAAPTQPPQPWIPPNGQTRPRFSQLAIWGFVISCVSLFVFGFIGVLGVALSARAFRAARTGLVRGRGLAIAGMIVGTLGFLYYAIATIIRLSA